MPEKPAKPVPPAVVPPVTPLETPADLQTKYVNMVRIVHSPAEIVFDFAHLLPGDPHARVQARVLMSPLSAKLFLRALVENITKYEASFGEIRIPGESGSLADSLFRAVDPPEEK